MDTWLLRIGGIWNGFFTLFHILSAVGIQTAPGLSPDIRALLQMLNVGLILMLAFATFASFACERDLLTTRLGRATIVLIALFYGVRVAEEIVISPAFSPLIFGLCLVAAVIYTALALRAPSQARRFAVGAAGSSSAS